MGPGEILLSGEEECGEWVKSEITLISLKSRFCLPNSMISNQKAVLGIFFFILYCKQLVAIENLLEAIYHLGSCTA